MMRDGCYRMEDDVRLDALQPSTNNRLISLDVFRGGTIAAMILVNNQPGTPWEPLEHAAWHGWTFTDLVFPFFLWIVGVAITLSFAKRVERGDDKGKLLRHVAIRSLAIYLIGLALAGFPYYNFATIRLPGVLARIAVCYFIASTLFLYCGTRARIWWTAALLTIYWLLMKLVPVPGCGAGSFTMECNFAKYIDGLFLTGHMYSQTKTWDPEGIVSTLPAICNTLFGIFAGELLKTKRSAEEKAAWLFLLGNVLTFAGLMLSTWMPINKKLWTSPYALFTSGLAFSVFACCYFLEDVKGWTRWSKPFIIYGSNALAVYVLSGLIARVLSVAKLSGPIWDNLYAPIAPPELAAFLYGMTYVAVLWLIAWLMYRRKWFVKV